ncbi:hypothetical protein V5N11_029812 [Cardamine amara subsp. amara]|uniref:Integrase catalytic domain-containing protein n=1 Tax=Cardamine amara subsp. amara TaxID=228776 RepID=A0ABD1AJQ4_CARAN
MPATIVSDRDRIFLSNFWKNLFKLAGTKLKYSSAYHPETDGQTEVLNRSLECYLRCYTSAKPSAWHKFLSWAELWYNCSYHTAIRTTPFKIVYGRDPPPLLRYESGSTHNFELEKELLARDEALQVIKHNLIKAQQLMKTAANKHRQHKEFVVGQNVYLKLRNYRQNSLATRLYKKLSAKYFGPFPIIERIGKVAYRLQLPSTAKIHNVFHISLLKEALGQQPVADSLRQALLQTEELNLEPEFIKGIRYNDKGHLEALVHWKGFGTGDDEWVNAKALLQQHPSVELGDKLPLKGGSIDRPFKVYFRKNAKKSSKSDDWAKDLQKEECAGLKDKGKESVAGEKRLQDSCRNDKAGGNNRVVADTA